MLQLKFSCSACVLVAGTQSFFPPNVAKYYYERKNNHFVHEKKNEINILANPELYLINIFEYLRLCGETDQLQLFLLAE